MADKIIIPVEAETEKANAELKKTKKEVDKVKKSSAELKDSVDQLSGGMISGFQKGLKSVKGLSDGLKTFRGRLIATGLGAFVVVLGTLIEYFRNFEGGVRLVNQVMNTLAGTINAIVGNFEKLLKGDFLGFFKGVKDGATEAWKETNNLFDAQEKLFELNKQFTKENAELNAVIKEQSRNIRDTTLSVEERIAAQEKINEASEKLLENEKALIEAEQARIKAELALENNYEKRRDLELQLLQTGARLISLESDLSIQRDNAAKQIRRINEEQEQEQKRQREEAAKQRAEQAKAEQARIDAALALEKEYDAQLRALRVSQIKDEEERGRQQLEIQLDAIREKYGQGTELELELIEKFNTEAEAKRNALRLQNEQKQIEQETIALENELMRLDENSFERLDKQAEILDRERRLKLENDELTNAERERIELEYNKKLDELGKARKQIIEREANAKKMAQMEIADALSVGINGIAQAAGDNKAIAIGAATIDTFLAANKALAQLGPIAGPIAATGIVASGIANVRKIASTEIPGANNAGASVPTTTGFDDVTRQRFDAFQQDTQGVQNVRDITEREPVQAFVLEGEVTSSQSTISRLRQRQRI